MAGSEDDPGIIPQVGLILTEISDYHLKRNEKKSSGSTESTKVSLHNLQT